MSGYWIYPAPMWIEEGEQEMIEVTTYGDEKRQFIPGIGESNHKNHRCEFCGGNTVDDMRGNCCACGAPRILTSADNEPIGWDF